MRPQMQPRFIASILIVGFLLFALLKILQPQSKPSVDPTPAGFAKVKGQILADCQEIGSNSFFSEQNLRKLLSERALGKKLWHLIEFKKGLFSKSENALFLYDVREATLGVSLLAIVYDEPQRVHFAYITKVEYLGKGAKPTCEIKSDLSSEAPIGCFRYSSNSKGFSSLKVSRDDKEPECSSDNSENNFEFSDSKNFPVALIIHHKLNIAYGPNSSYLEKIKVQEVGKDFWSRSRKILWRTYNFIFTGRNSDTLEF